MHTQSHTRTCFKVSHPFHVYHWITSHCKKGWSRSACMHSLVWSTANSWAFSHRPTHTHTQANIYTLTQTRIQMKEAKRILSNDNPTHFLSVLAVHFKGCSVCRCVCVKDFGKAVLFNAGTSFMAAFDRDIKTFIMNTFTSRPSEVIQLSFYRKPQKDQLRTL